MLENLAEVGGLLAEAGGTGSFVGLDELALDVEVAKCPGCPPERFEELASLSRGLAEVRQIRQEGEELKLRLDAAGGGAEVVNMFFIRSGKRQGNGGFERGCVFA